MMGTYSGQGGMRNTLKWYFLHCDHEPNTQNHLKHLFTIHIPRALARNRPRNTHFLITSLKCSDSDEQ